MFFTIDLPLFVIFCILEQYCFLSFISFVLRHLCPVLTERTRKKVFVDNEAPKGSQDEGFN